MRESSEALGRLRVELEPSKIFSRTRSCISLGWKKSITVGNTKIKDRRL